MIQRLLDSLRGGLGRIAQAPSVVQQPLLDEAELQELVLFARTLPGAMLDFERPSDHPRIGETPSLYRGRGFDFEENRAYQPGDEPRLLNWRLYARTGELYTKVFTEERRPELFVLVDRRAAMRFGTRRRLKATQAARIAACYAALAQHQSIPTGVLLLDRTAEWYAPAAGEVLRQPWVRALTAPCPPLDLRGAQASTEEGLQLVLHRLPAGCLVLLISDFSDLDPDSGRTLLYPLAARHTVRAIQVLDPAERELPSGGDYLIEEPGSSEPIRVDSGDAWQRSHYAEAWQARQERLAACFRSCGIPLHTCSTDDAVETCMRGQ